MNGNVVGVFNAKWMVGELNEKRTKYFLKSAKSTCMKLSLATSERSIHEM